MYVIITVAPPGIIHVYGDPSWDTRPKAMVQMMKIRDADREEYPDQPPIFTFVRKVIIIPSEKEETTLDAKGPREGT